MATLDSAVLQEFLRNHAQWEFSSDATSIERIFQFRSYMEGIDFVTKVAHIAEELDHHPQMIVDWAKVTVRASTHDAGGTVTEKDIALAAAIDAMV